MEIDVHLKCIQGGIDSTQNKAQSAENTGEITEEQMYYSLNFETAEKPDLVHATHWVNESCQLQYVPQQTRLSEWKRYEVPLCQTDQFRKIVEESEKKLFEET